MVSIKTKIYYKKREHDSARAKKVSKKKQTNDSKKILIERLSSKPKQKNNINYNHICQPLQARNQKFFRAGEFSSN